VPFRNEREKRRRPNQRERERWPRWPEVSNMGWIVLKFVTRLV